MLRIFKKFFFALRRLKSRKLILIVVIILAALLIIYFRTSPLVSETLRPPLGLIEKDLSHFRRSRSLRHYLDNIDVLVEPSSLPCGEAQQPSILALVATAPGHVERRDAIRRTWGQQFPTYFVVGLNGTRDDGHLKDYYEGEKQYRDMVIFDFKDHYQNLTLKTGLMIRWTLDRCPQTKFLYKVDDDVLINPWILRQVVKENSDAKLIGYVNHNRLAHRDETNKWYLPRWLCPNDFIPQHLSGPGYLIKGELLRDILKAAYGVPLHNLEDVYFTCHVAHQTLGYKLTHDERMCLKRREPFCCPFSYLFPACAYWISASMHGFRPEEILRYYPYIRSLGEQYGVQEQRDIDSICTFYRTFIKPFLVMLCYCH